MFVCKATFHRCYILTWPEYYTLRKKSAYLLRPVPFKAGQGGDYTIFSRNLIFFFCPCHNFFPLSSVQIIIIPACCLLCVL